MGKRLFLKAVVLTIVGFCSFYFKVNAQLSNDSLLNLLTVKYPPGEEIVNDLNKVAKGLFRKNPSFSIKLSDKAIRYSEKIDYAAGKGRALLIKS